MKEDISKDGLSKSEIYPCGFCGFRIKANPNSVYYMVYRFTGDEVNRVIQRSYLQEKEGHIERAAEQEDVI